MKNRNIALLTIHKLSPYVRIYLGTMAGMESYRNVLNETKLRLKTYNIVKVNNIQP